MADNVEITAGSGTSIRTDDVSGVHVQIVKVGLGADGALDNVVDAGSQLSAASVPVVLASDHADVKVTLDSEEVTANLGATDNAVLDDIAAALLSLSYALNTNGYDYLLVLGASDTATGNTVAGFPQGAMVQGSDGTYRRNLHTDASGDAQVDVLGIAAGDNNIGNVDIVTLPGTGTEDAAETAGGTLLMAGAVRRDVPASSSGATGDNSTVNVNKLGALWNCQQPAVPYKNIDVDESEDAVSAAACMLMGFYAFNNAAAGTKRYLKLYNATTANVTVGTTVPDMTFELDGGQGLVWNTPLYWSTALTVAATTGVADNDSGAPSANDVVFNCGYIAI